MGFTQRLRPYAQIDFQLGFPSPTDWQTLADLSLPALAAARSHFQLGNGQRGYFLRIQRVMSGQRQMAKALFTLLSEVLDEGASAASEAYIDRLLERNTFWAVAAVEQSTVVGGLTAHVLPMTRAEESELLIYDIAVDESWQRRGVGKMLVDWVRNEASVQGVDSVFVLADNEDAHAISFYKALGGAGSPVTLFEWK